MVLEHDIYPTLLEVARKRDGLFTESTDAFLKAARSSEHHSAPPPSVSGSSDSHPAKPAAPEPASVKRQPT